MAQKEDEALCRELMGIWSTVRTAFAEYRLDEAVPYLDIPASEARPSREDARAMAEFLPQIDLARFLALKREGNVAALYTETTSDPGETEVTVFRFQQVEGRWKIYPPPHSCSSLSIDKTDAEGIAKMMAERSELAAVPAAE